MSELRQHLEAEDPGTLVFNEVTGVHQMEDLVKIDELEAEIQDYRHQQIDALLAEIGDLKFQIKEIRKAEKAARAETEAKKIQISEMEELSRLLEIETKSVIVRQRIAALKARHGLERP